MNAPATVGAWILQPPEWCEIRQNPPLDPALQFLDAGESAAITLACSVNADRLLIDEQALAQLRQTNFYVSADLIDRVRLRLSTGV